MEWPMTPSPIQNMPHHQTMTSHFKTYNGTLPPIKDIDFVDYKLCLQEINDTCC